MAHRDTSFRLSSVLLAMACVALGCSSAHEPGTRACSAGDTPPACARPWSGDLSCCTPAAAASCVGGSWQCAPAARFASECTRVDPICEGVDASRPPPPRDAGPPPPRDAGGPPAWQACGSPSDCAVRAESCCGACGAATSGDMIGVNRDRQVDYLALACAGGIACPECAARQDPALVATCSSGLCEAVDLGAAPVTECVADTDCNLAVAQCCACGTTDPWEVVSIATARAGDLYTLICDPGLDCGPCPGPVTFPAGLSAGCDTGRCVVRGR